MLKNKMKHHEMIQVDLLKIHHTDLNTLLRAFKPMLPDEVIEKTSQYKNPADQLRHLAGEILSRVAIKKHTGFYPDTPFLSSKHGKPYLAHHQIEFNISHSGNYVALALSKNNIGVDIEKLRHNKMRVARRFFSDAEIDLLRGSGNPDNDFTRLWSLKEAYLKYSGSGLTEALNTFTVKESKQSNIFEVYDSDGIQKNIRLFHKMIDNGYFLSVCFDENQYVDRIKETTLQELLKFAANYEK
ncbi:MAG: 4'-phosphopantetheinyl transferase family protein [Bacteroidota bacterium]